ncbi:uncharacterized protein A4U43_C03F22180 [Asparagus officinalis]|uniref:Uncharacterized protein n=1 Tax=Asparagus officinalis TaxID=4686 RepID=A0A5P1FH14_ASPOF|nr:uncharacterized protein LOC109835170 [Asparagus officinalis]ONK75941.1 uncharacterized protein A4U43_C03F22180 [Asparagus officinalis]
MGVCFSKKKKKRSKDSVGSGEKSKPIQDCRDPPPTESPQEEEKVKEVLSETPKLAAVRSKDDEIVKRSRSRGNDDGEEKEEPGVNGDATPTPSESATTTATAAFTEQSKAGDEEEEEVGISEKKKTRPRPRPRSRSQSPAKVVHKRTNSRSSDHRDFPAAVASATKKREMRAVDVGCRTSRSAPSPLKNRSISSRRDTGERSGRRSASPADNDSKMRSFCAPEPAATTTTTTKGRSSPQ